MSTPPVATRHHNSTKLWVLLPLRALQFRPFQYDTPCNSSLILFTCCVNFTWTILSILIQVNSDFCRMPRPESQTIQMFLGNRFSYYANKNSHNSRNQEQNDPKMQVMYIFDPSIPPFGWARITRPTGWGCVVDIKKEPKINK